MRGNRPLRIVHVSGVWGYDRPAAGAARQDEQSRSILAEAARLATAQEPGLSVATATAWGKVSAALRREAAYASLLVLGRHGHGLTAALRLGSAVRALAAQPPCPLVVVAGAPAEPWGEVVVGFDEQSRADLAFAFAEADRRGARLRAIHAWTPPVFSAFVGGDLSLYTELFDDACAAAHETLQPWRERHPLVPVVEEAVCGGAVAALTAASARADLVVVGSRKAMLGSVTSGVLHGAWCPVAVVHATPVPAAARSQG
ncbi:universal stress protein [Nonomuraea sp. NPDC050310]|uniref:universal stress protein n=1 Tax=Nonomuraea sp. NPDC050310 TaxID=3154935 RepID=UPI0033F03720